MQTLKPISDASIGGWTTNSGATTNLYDTLDEAVASDADYVKSSPNPSQDVLRLKLTTGLSEPTDNTGYGIDYKIFKQGALSGNLTVRLVEGASSVIATWVHSDVSSTPTEFNQTLTAGQADAITDHNDLYIEFIADQGLIFLVDDQYLTDQDPLVSGGGEPVGNRVVVGNLWWIEEDELRGGSQITSPTWDASKVYYGSQARTQGRALYGVLTPEDAAAPLVFGYETATTVADPTTDGNAFRVSNYGVHVTDQGTSVMLAGGSLSSIRDTHPKDYFLSVVQKSQGALYLASTFDTDNDTTLTGYVGGIPQFPLARIVWVSDKGTQPLYPVISAREAVDTLNPYPHGHRLQHTRVIDVEAFASEAAYALFYDRVTRADSATTVGGPFTSVDGIYGVVSNKIYYVSGGTWPHATAVGASDGIFKFKITAPTTLTNTFGAVLRQIDTSNFLRLWNNGANNSLTLQSWVNGGFDATHVNYTVNWVAGQEYEITVILVGDKIKVFVNGADPSGSGTWVTCSVHMHGTKYGPFGGGTGARWDDLMFYPTYITLPTEFNVGKTTRKWGVGDTYITDTFTGTDGTVLNGRTTTTGSATWTQHTGGQMQIGSNAIVTTGTGPWVATVPEPALNFEVSANISRAVAGNPYFGGFVLKYNPSTGRGVSVRLLWDGTSEIEIIEMNAGQANGEHNGVVRKVDIHQKLSTGAAFKLKVQIIGSELRVYLDGHPKLSHKLSQSFDGTRVGFYEETYPDTVWDNFEIRAISTSENVELPVPTNNRIVGIGDSITVASHNTATQGITYNSGFQPRILNPSGSVGGYLTWAMILPRTGAQMGDGRFEFVGTHATGGAQASTIKTTHIDGTDSPLNDNPKPSFAVVLAGSNDIGAVAPSNVVNPTQLASTLDAIESIWDTLIANDILPIACMLPPNNGTAQNAILAINQGIRERGHAKGLVVVDLFTPCWSGTGATWGTNMHMGDGTHPSVLGAKLMGQALRDAIDPLLLPTPPNIVDADTDAASDLMLHNGAFERDTNSDNIPNGGRTSGSETATFWILTANGATPTLAARTNFSGKALRLNKTDDTAGNTLLSSSGGSDALSLVDGHLYKVLLKGEIASWSGTNTQIIYQAIKVTGDVPFRITFQNDFSFSGAIAPFIVGRTFLISNTGNFTSGSYRGGQVSIGFSTAGATTDNLGDVYFGQITYRDLGLA